MSSVAPYARIAMLGMFISIGWMAWAREPVLVNADGFGNPGNIGIVYMEPHDGELYAGTDNRADGCIVYASSDGFSWSAANDPGFGDADNFVIVKMRSWGDYLYVGTWNNTTAGQLWRATNPAHQADWELVVGNGFGNPANVAVASIRSFKGWLYVGMFNPSQGQEMWRSPDGSAGSFQKSFDAGSGVTGNTDASFMLEWNGLLYLGAEAADTPWPGCQVWRTPGPDVGSGDDWERVSDFGFGDRQNWNAFRMAVFKGYLYVGTWGDPDVDGTEVWRTAAAGGPVFSDWEQVNADGFGNTNYGSTLAMAVLGDNLYVGGFGAGGFLYCTEDGTTWESVTPPNFFHDAQYGVHALAPFDGRLFIGIQNSTKPTELWVLSATSASRWWALY